MAAGHRAPSGLQRAASLENRSSSSLAARVCTGCSHLDWRTTPRAARLIREMLGNARLGRACFATARVRRGSVRSCQMIRVHTGREMAAMTERLLLLLLCP
ncbi:hypothetical protein MTO96_013132 [Rhipicephalus appendiculatus]